MTDLVTEIRNQVIGANQKFPTVFGEMPLVYADYTASGRSLGFIEDYIRHSVLPWYANTHTETSYTGAQTTRLREQARSIIRRAVKGSELDRVIFCGSGATTGINKLIDILGLRLPRELDQQYQFSSQIPENQRPVVFVGPYEHHSNELPWRESIADVVTIPLSSSSQIDTEALKSALEKYRERPVKIGSFSAASNVTGIISDVHGVTSLLKQFGALSFWDFAAAGPYLPIDMNGDTPLDAVFLSPHKFVGGPGTSGVLVVKASVMGNQVPVVVGGGTVVYVRPDSHRFISDHERREEGGTPAIVESIRTGLVFKLQQEVTTDVIHRKEQDFIRQALKRFEANPNIEVLGETDVPRLSIFSLRVKHKGKDLHYGFVTALLNDLFGIQVRGGCSCAGPYGHTLLNLDDDYSERLEERIKRGEMVLRPGWVRLNFNYFISPEECAYILDAIDLVANHGWRLMPYYELDSATGIWRFQGRDMALTSSLEDFSFAEGIPSQPANTGTPNYVDLLVSAQAWMTGIDVSYMRYSMTLSEEGEALRWFALPQECLAPEPLLHVSGQ